MQSPFDIMAETYDARFTYTSIGQLQRQQVWNHIHGILNAGAGQRNILEINCGTGEDAVELARLGHTVTATDGSEMMIEKARAKALSRGAGQVTFKKCRFDELGSSFANDKFDLVVSNFGGLNCIDSTEITKLGNSLAGLLRANGKVLMVIMSNCCIWELIYFSLQARLKLAFRRQKKAVSFRAGDAQMSVFYYSPMKLRKLFRDNYRLSGVHPVGLFVPPSYLEKNFSHRPRLLQQLARMDYHCNRYSFLSNFADHFCIIFQKKEAV